MQRKTEPLKHLEIGPDWFSRDTMGLETPPLREGAAGERQRQRQSVTRGQQLLGRDLTLGDYLLTRALTVALVINCPRGFYVEAVSTAQPLAPRSGRRFGISDVQVQGYVEAVLH